MNLIERLRTHTMCPTPEEAADALESLTAERDALNTEAERLSQHATVIRAQRDALKTERDALRAEAGDLTVQQRNSYQKGHNAGVAHHKEATKALRLAAQAGLDALAADAARYRFVRSNGLVRVQVDVDFMNAWGEYSHEALDAAIDAAIQGAGE